jgi:histidine ammonia-lyase
LRPHEGQISTAAKMRELLKDSQLIKQEKAHVQDPYCLRCIPQVHGASRDTLSYVMKVTQTELNSVTDNPTIFPEEEMVVSAGNFHGQPLAISLDLIAIAMSEIGSISERRSYKLNGGGRGLPSFLVKKPGLNSGFMITQYTSASVVSENKQLCSPASVDTIDSSQGQEDHVSMGANAATKAKKVLDNLARILSIELFTAAQALEFRGIDRSSNRIQEVLEEFRKIVPFIEQDEEMYRHMKSALNFITQNSFTDV